MPEMYQPPTNETERTAFRQARHRQAGLLTDYRRAVISYLELTQAQREALDWKARIDYVYEQTETKRAAREHSTLSAREQIAAMLLTRHGHAPYAERMLADPEFRQIVGLA